VGTSPDPRPTVGLIGLGNMGAAVAERLLDAGHALVLYNRTPEKAAPLAERGGTVAESPSALAAEVEVVLTSLADDDALESVAAEVVAAAPAGAVLVDLSTVSPDASARVAEEARRGGVAYVRAPVSGNPSVVRAGTLTFIVSGPDDAIDRVLPVLLAIGPTVHRVGDGEQARVVKLAINLVIGGLAELMSEALVLGEAAGVSRQALLEVMGSSAAGAPFVKYKTEPLLRDDYSATFTTALMEKDVDLILETAREHDVELPVATQLKSLLRSAIEAGYGDHDFMALFLHLRSASNQEVAR
jgi:3-hydroxyisobutyrate dehydrogenase-like beta-hydroxyacid dehydrogenase